ncbi:molybdopterin synthase catalytic subunit MoaE [Halopseudomonas oceani]|uniref:Molybdopterin synthase catalytic subunit n=1 Tax=Halopseudomonas oceani TaxID=1708783 RepID=A0A2P4EWR0_9GAMM|nr:molybdopterin synthase catalytic subunit MoaE [Halopseudomonas oceani]POB04394.1 molybdopterin synthase catalytic subunit MoaE [Halopseudomonas oceani]
MLIEVQQDHFDPGERLNRLHADHLGVGAVVGFVGYVRDYNEGDAVAGMWLEHYPGMTEKALAGIVEQAQTRWPLLDVQVLHRVGQLEPGEPIVFVGVASAHRQAAFEANAFIMDYLKTRAPFWKREATPDGERWVEARDSDEQALARWQQD